MRSCIQKGCGCNSRNTENKTRTGLLTRIQDLIRLTFLLKSITNASWVQALHTVTNWVSMSMQKMQAGQVTLAHSTCGLAIP